MIASSLPDILRPFLWLTVAAFLAGFLGYAAFSGPAAPTRAASQFAPRVSAPAAYDWNLPKRI